MPASPMPTNQNDVPEPVQLNAALRELIEAVRTADLDGVDLADSIAQVRGLRDGLRPSVVAGPRMQAGLVYEPPPTPDTAPGRSEKLGVPSGFAEEHPADFFPYSPLVGPLNPISPPATMTRVAVGDGFEVHGEVTFQAAFNGPPDCVHGGMIAALFDELLGCACVVNGVGGYTGTLTVVYRTPTPLGEPLAMRGWRERSEGRKVFARGTLHAGERLCATAEAVFIQSETLPNPTC